jgi:ribonuclease P protein subunit RPR2
VFSVADTLDALTSDRPYRPATSWEQARAIIVAEAGTQFDPAVIDAYQTIPDATFAQLRDGAP